MAHRKAITTKGKTTRFVAYMPQTGLTPRAKEEAYRQTTEPWVLYGRNNLFPEYIRTRMDNCGPLEKCASLLAQFIAGNGVRFYTKNGDEVTEAQAAFQALLRDTTEEDFLQKTAYDIAHGLGMSWVVRRSATGDIVRLDHLDVIGYRSGPMEDDLDSDGLPTRRVKLAYWSPDWSEFQMNKTDQRYQPVTMPTFQYGDSVERFAASVLYDRHYKPRQPYYSVPWFLSALPACETWEQVDEYNRTQLTTGFTPAIIAGFRMDGTESDIENQLEKMELAYQGANGSSFFPFPMGPGEQEPFFKELKRGNHAGEVDAVRTGAADVICDVYGVPSILFRDRTEGLTSQANTIAQRLQQFDRTVVQPMQKLITRNLVKLVGIPEVWEAKIDPLEVFDPVQSEAIVMASTTINEAREDMGKEPLPEKIGGKLLIDAKAMPETEEPEEEEEDEDEMPPVQ